MAVWAAATALMVLVPLLAMRVTDEVSWTGFDFAYAGALIFAVGVAWELAAKKTGNRACRAAVGVALVAAFLLVWMNGAVGIVGSEDNPANLMYGGVLAVGIVGAVIARFRAEGMARAQGSVALIALIAEGREKQPTRPETLQINPKIRRSFPDRHQKSRHGRSEITILRGVRR